MRRLAWAILLSGCTIVIPDLGDLDGDGADGRDGERADDAEHGDDTGDADDTDDTDDADDTDDTGDADDTGDEADDTDAPGTGAEGADRTMLLVLEEVDRADALVDVEVLGGPVGVPVVLAIAPAAEGLGACLDEIAPVCLDVGPELADARSRRTDDDGEAWWEVPWSLAGGSGALELQAYAVVGAEVWVSNSLWVELR